MVTVKNVIKDQQQLRFFLLHSNRKTKTMLTSDTDWNFFILHFFQP